MPDYQITLETAVRWTTDFRAASPHRTKAYRIDREEMEQILATDGAAYVRAYFGIDAETNDEKLILVAVDSDGNDIIDTNPERDSNIYDFTLPCPSTCDLASPLNS